MTTLTATNTTRITRISTTNFEENVFCFIEELQQFDYRIDSIDLIWEVIFPHSTGKRTTYYYIGVTKYKDTFYITHVDGRLCTLEVKINKSVDEAETFRSRDYCDLAKKWNGSFLLLVTGLK